MASEACRWDFKAVGYIESCFKRKNGTPRQPVVTESSRATLTISKQLYDNPEHSVDGLQHFSHIWVIFVFHKNNNPYTKAKVRPPRLNGAKVGLFSTRSPYRPNNIGLTLAKLDKIEGATLHLSGVDMLDGTPVLDIKPYIPDYDQPRFYGATPAAGKDGADTVDTAEHQVAEHVNTTAETSSVVAELGTNKSGTPPMDIPVPVSDNDSAVDSGFSRKLESNENENICGEDLTVQKSTLKKDDACDKMETDDNIFPEVDALDHQDHKKMKVPPRTEGCGDGNEDGFRKSVTSKHTTENVGDTNIAGWVSQPPIQRLNVRYSDSAQAQLLQFHKTPSDPKYFLTFLNDPADAKRAITDILQADPRSTYRRKKCVDRLYFFILDTLHITCWFDDTVNLVEVVRIRPVSECNQNHVSKD